MVFFNLTSHKYFKCLMVAVYKLNSESNAETVYLCQENVIFASSFKKPSVKCSQSKGRELSSSWIYTCSQAVLEMFYSWALHAEEGIQRKSPQYFSSRCLIMKTSHFLNLPICKSPIKKMDSLQYVFEKATGY